MYQPTCVFLLIFNKPDPYLLAILKADTEGYPWRNQVALPGGHIDTNDASPTDAAFRELKEELNIPKEQVELIGSMGHFQTINNRDIEVFIGLWNGLGPVRYETREIARVLEIPLQVLANIHRTKHYHAQRNDLQQFNYPIDDLTIWGATARILHYFIELWYRRDFSSDPSIF
ncbi:CoA pyrophosphatase [Desulfococcaceae bacterium HSG9]|nr:CoA pyrophosphatase [Desulfococcaceae bacterium HSG9]